MFDHRHLLGLDTDVGYIIISIQNPQQPLMVCSYLPGCGLGKAVPVNPQDLENNYGFFGRENESLHEQV